MRRRDIWAIDGQSLTPADLQPPTAGWPRTPVTLDRPALITTATLRCAGEVRIPPMASPRILSGGDALSQKLVDSGRVQTRERCLNECRTSWTKPWIPAIGKHTSRPTPSFLCKNPGGWIAYLRHGRRARCTE